MLDLHCLPEVPSSPQACPASVMPPSLAAFPSCSHFPTPSQPCAWTTSLITYFVLLLGDTNQDCFVESSCFKNLLPWVLVESFFLIHKTSLTLPQSLSMWFCLFVLRNEVVGSNILIICLSSLVFHLENVVYCWNRNCHYLVPYCRHFLTFSKGVCFFPLNIQTAQLNQAASFQVW